MRYSLIVPAWNEAAFISDTLQQVKAVIEQLHEHTNHIGELIVVDNNSTDNTAAIAALKTSSRKNMKILFKWKKNYWIKLLIMNNFFFCHNVNKCSGKGFNVYLPFPIYNKFAVEDFKNILANIWENLSIIIE